MKNILFIIIGLLISHTNIHADNKNHYVWGDDVDVRDHEIVTFVLPTKYSHKKLKVEVEEFSGFECDVELAPRNSKSVYVYVGWGPGADYSGCHIEIFTPLRLSLGVSEVYMIY